jgi:hypothetical protein
MLVDALFRSQRLTDRPAVDMNAGVERSIANAKFSCPLQQGQSFAVSGDRLLVRGDSKALLEGPSNPAAVEESGARDAELAAPLSNGLHFAVHHHDSIFARVVGLLLLCSPSTILRRVIAIVIEAFELVARGGAHPHVVEEVAEGCAPSTTHLNAATAIVYERLIRCVVTTTNHSAPNVIQRMVARGAHGWY